MPDSSSKLSLYNRAPEQMRRRRTRCARLSLTLLLILGGTRESVSSPFDLYGAGSRGSAMGNVGAASSVDCAAAHYNPAALVAGAPQLVVGLHSAIKRLSIKLSERPSGYDIPDLGFDSPAVPTRYRLRQREGSEVDHLGLNLYGGASTDLGTDQLRLGLLFSLPVYRSEESQGSFFNDEREQFFSNRLHFDLLGRRVEHFVVQLAGAWQVTEWLALGLGAHLSAQVTSNNEIYMDDPTRQDQIDLNVGLATQTQWIPSAGILLTPSEAFSLGFSFRDAQSLEIEGVNTVQVRGLQESDRYPFEQRMQLSLEYQPRRFLSGLSWRSGAHLLSTDLAYLQWSAYPTHHREEANFQDTLSVRFGAEHQLHDKVTLRWGAGYEPTPVGPQTGRSNFVDNDRIVGSLGTGHRFRFAEKTLQLSWHLQLHWLSARQEEKALRGSYPTCDGGGDALCDEVPDNPDQPETLGLQTGNPGFPGFSSGGVLAHMGVEVIWSF